MIFGWVSFVAERSSELWLRTAEHILLTGVSTGIAIAFGVPLGILAARSPWLRAPLLGAISILQTIPSLAMLAILLALLQKIGSLPAVVALVLYALLPIVRNTLTGIEEVSSDILEAARGLGMTPRQQLWAVQLPLAMPTIVAGVRTAAVVCVGIATLSAFIGAGGLGQFINRGLALANTPLILLGAIPAALLAIAVDLSISAFDWGRKPLRKGAAHPLKAVLKPLALAAPLLLVSAGPLSFLGFRMQVASQAKGSPSLTESVCIATKNFIEQILLGELMAQIIEEKTDLAVERRFNLGGTMICHGALESGEVDLYAEYTGTALAAVLEREPVTNPAEALQIVKSEYRKRFACEWLPPFGFNNTYAITVRREEARENGWEKISDLSDRAAGLSAGFTSEFMERPDGYPGLSKKYGIQFGQIRDLDPSLMYEAIAKEEVDVVCAFSTDGRIAAYDLEPLDDDLAFFPPYQAAPVVRRETLRKHPEVRDVLELLAGALDDSAMQNLNYQADEEKKSPVEVARRFLERNPKQTVDRAK